MIQIQQLFFQYPRTTFALSIDRIDIAPGEKVAIIGPSGSGKTTLLNLIAGIEIPKNGTLQIAGKDIGKLNAAQRRNFRVAEIGFIFQRFELIEYLNVQDNILFPFLINGSLKLNPIVRRRMSDLAAAMNIDGDLKRFPGQLSQGEKQRVAICRSLITSPQLLIADEPTGNLDPANKQIILDLIFEHAQQPDSQSNSPRSLLVVTHDMTVASKFDRTIDFADFYHEPSTTSGGIAGPESPPAGGGS